MFRFVRMRSSHARRFVPGVYERHDLNARAYVSWTSSSASSRDPLRCRATRKTWSASASASSSKRTRSRASVAILVASSVITATVTKSTCSSCGAFPVGKLDDRDLAEAGLRHHGEQVVPGRLLVVPRERHLAHEVRVRALEALVPGQRGGESVDAALAAD